jgi:NitT/TauT family transport system substrate-binding protein
VTEVRIGFFPNITHGQALYARATGDFEKATGAKLKWTPFNAGPTAIESMFTDAVDMTFIGPGPTINGYMKSRGQKFVVISGAASGGAGLVVRKDAGITSEKDLARKKIATPQLGNTQDIAARSWFASKNIKLKERGGTLDLLPLANPDQLTMFRKKEIDGAWTIEPWLARLELEGGGELFLDEKTLWPDGKYATTHLIVNKAFLNKNPDLIRKLLAAHVDITQKMNSDKAAAAKVLNEQLKKETGKALKEEVITRALERVEFTWDPIRSSLFQGAEAAHRIGFIRTKPQLDGIYSLDSLNEVLKQKGLAAVTN